jgi:hypothetical protein
LNVPISDRIFDLKLRLPQGAKFYRYQISKYGLVLRDDVRLATLGITRDELELRLDILDKPICSLFFEKAKKVVRKHLACKGRTFGDICALFSTVPVTVGFEYQGNTVKKTTPLDSQCWDPAFPIRVVKRNYLPIVFENFPDWNTEVHMLKDIAIDNIKSFLLSHFNDLFSFKLFVGRHEAKSGSISQLNPDMEPVVVRNIKLVKRPHFIFSGKEVAVNLSRETTMCEFVKAFLAGPMSCASASVELFDNGHPISDSVKLLESGNYEIRLRNVIRRFLVELPPKRKESWFTKPEFVKECEIDVGSVTSAQAFIRHFTFECQLGSIANMRLMRGETEIGMDAFMVDFPDQCKFAFEWAFEVDSCCYSCQASPNTWRPLLVSSTTTVANMKLEFMRMTNQPSQLPGDILISFWGIELKDSDLVLGYGIPDGSHLDVSNESRLFTVLNYDGENSTFIARRGDTLASVKDFYAEQNSINCSAIDFLCDDKRLTDDEQLWDLPTCKLRVVHRKENKYVQTLRYGEIPVACDGQTTVDHAVRQLASYFSVAPNQIRLTIPSRLLLPTETIFGIEDQIACSLLSLLKYDEQREFFFFYTKALFVFRFNVFLTVSEIESILKDEFKIEKALSIVADGKKVDPGCPLSQLEEGVVLGFALPPWEGKIVLATADSPKWIQLTMSPTAKLAEVEMQLRAQHKLGEMEIQFSLTSCAEAIDKTCQVGRINTVLVARQKNYPEKTFRFTSRQRGKPIEFTLAQNAFVGEARERLMAEFGVPREKITLFAAGRFLRDGFVLANLAEGEEIGVHVKGLTPFAICRSAQ